MTPRKTPNSFKALGVDRPTAIRIADQATAGWKFVPWRPLHGIVIVFSIALLVAGGFSFSALVFIDEPAEIIDRAWRNFSAPVLIGGWLATALYLTIRDRIAASSIVYRQLLWLLLLIIAVVGIWISLNHWATWLEWQGKRTPTVFGSDWFYAEVYMFYVREEGILITVATALTIGLPTVWLLIRMLWVVLFSQKKRGLIKAHAVFNFSILTSVSGVVKFLSRS